MAKHLQVNELIGMRDEIDRAIKAVGNRAVNQLIGLAEGIIADGKVTQVEAEALKKWLDRNSIPEYPLFALLKDRVDKAFPEGVLDAEGAAALLDMLGQLTGGDLSDGEMLKSLTLALDPEPRRVCIPGKAFVFTGKANFGERSEMKDLTKRAGGVVHKGLRLDTHYLVLGTYGNPTWKYQSYGGKIEKAMEYRDRRGTGLSIVHEDDWRVALKPSEEDR